MRIQFENVGYVFQKGSPFEEVALENVNLTIPSNSFVTVLGKTGSGKTTALQLIKGLLKPTDGKISYSQCLDGASEETIFKSSKQTREERKVLEELWKSIGYLFQYPEHQLFEETVEQDISYGPKNLGLTQTKTAQRVTEAMESVGLGYDEYAKRSPFALSGGQMRKVAMAGVLAMKPKVAILDEPMAGLDPTSKANMAKMIASLHKQYSWTTLCVSHHIDEFWPYSDHFLIFDNKKVIFAGSRSDLLSQLQKQSIPIDPPLVVKLAIELQNKGILKQSLSELSTELESEEHFAKYLGRLLC